MGETAGGLRERGFLRGKARNCFWALPAYIPVILVSPIIANILVVRLSFTQNETAMAITAVINAALVTLGWAALFLIYGIKNRIQAQKTIFSYLAAHRSRSPCMWCSMGFSE